MIELMHQAWGVCKVSKELLDAIVKVNGDARNTLLSHHLMPLLGCQEAGFAGKHGLHDLVL
jgi:hypothetical protein